ncbi:hypothetical protein H5410_057060 [Solanum commersonii]|uniref:Uncharacterized protein n=1 Tax=Solanum commersonii TaxID=4109 RepID=A0A9J5WPT6_SOLCO|nr:hypothetical protein H5410_057060 [Solanum commersonii]
MFLMNWVCIETQTSLRQYQNKPKRLEAVLRMACCTPRCKERWNNCKRDENKSNPDVWVDERAERTFNDFHQYVSKNLDTEALDGVQIAAMSAQIAQLTSALVESEQRREAEQQIMIETVQQIKEQVMNLTRRPTTSAPDDTDDDSDDKDDYVDPTP